MKAAGLPSPARSPCRLRRCRARGRTRPPPPRPAVRRRSEAVILPRSAAAARGRSRTIRRRCKGPAREHREEHRHERAAREGNRSPHGPVGQDGLDQRGQKRQQDRKQDRQQRDAERWHPGHGAAAGQLIRHGAGLDVHAPADEAPEQRSRDHGDGKGNDQRIEERAVPGPLRAARSPRAALDAAAPARAPPKALPAGGIPRRNSGVPVCRVSVNITGASRTRPTWKNTGSPMMKPESSSAQSSRRSPSARTSACETTTAPPTRPEACRSRSPGR